MRAPFTDNTSKDHWDIVWACKRMKYHFIPLGGAKRSAEVYQSAILALTSIFQYFAAFDKL